MKLATRFGRGHTSIRSQQPLTNEEIASVAPSIFATDKHDSRSERYTYIPTIEVLEKLRSEGFMPFMACQARCRDEGKREHTKHMLRLRHANQIVSSEANEIILLNSHDGTSSYQMLAGTYRFVCCNGMVCGDTVNEIRVPHKGNIVDNVIEGAFRVVDDFERINGQIDGMKSLSLNDGEQLAFAQAALALKYDPQTEPAPITERQILEPKRREDAGNDLWKTFNRVQERMLKGGVHGRTTKGRRTTTRAVTGIDQDVRLNRALWVLAEQMKILKH
ncbi:DUF932 domain-containing protein [Massilia sp. Root1485]|uniref:DUF932 domain-containing protein n=1 Tax=Massilia sp. Root1485 TaxID=1736472 RepID=UPI0006F6F83D|nr:DUF932 domain-containing protein [Massilia sp. Root1485]KQZ34933.1 hypothetical protein ASD92_07495 [Massilia sp. Root1485]